MQKEAGIVNSENIRLLTPITIDFRGRTKEFLPEKFRTRLANSVERLKQAHPEDAFLIENLVASTFGPLYPGYQALEAQEELGIERAVLSARTQQNLVHLLIHSNSEYASPETIDNAYFLASAFEHLSDVGGADARQIRQWWTGVKSQYAIMELLKRYDFDVIAPNSNNSEEVKDWDVRAGIDFAALGTLQSGPIILCIDAKSRFYNRPPFYTVGVPQPIEEHLQSRRTAPPSVLRTLDSFRKRSDFKDASIVYLEMGISPYQSNLRLKLTGDKQEALRDLGRLDDETALGIMTQLEDLSMKFAA